LKNPSIKTRIQAAVVLFIATALTLSAVVFYLKIQEVFESHTQKDLKSIATLVGREIEFVDGQVIDDWYDDIQADPISREKDYIQSWNIHRTHSQRSPALGDSDLPSFHGELGEFIYRDVTLPHHGKTHRAKAVGVLVMPSTAELTKAELLKIPQPLEPHILVVATDTERYERFLDHFKWGIGLTILTITIFSILIIHYILRTALLPIQELSSEIAEKNIDQLDAGFLIKPKFPSELRELITQYNGLLARVENVRIREKNFSSYVAHELRTPLAGISTTLELALNRPRESGYYQNSINEALQITSSMQSLIERLMILSRLQNNVDHLEYEPVNLLSITQQSWDDFSDRISDRHLTVSWPKPKTHTDCQVTSDFHLVYTLIHNLLDNATSYAPKHTTISVAEFLENDQLTLTISNQTTDLRSEDIDHFFDPFFRKDAARTLEDKHFGMGLPICREITRLLHAELQANLEKDGQLTMKLRFPLSQEHPHSIC